MNFRSNAVHFSTALSKIKAYVAFHGTDIGSLFPQIVLKSPSTNFFCPMLIVTSGFLLLAFFFFVASNLPVEFLLAVLSLTNSSNDIIFLVVLNPTCGLPNELPLLALLLAMLLALLLALLLTLLLALLLTLLLALLLTLLLALLLVLLLGLLLALWAALVVHLG